MSQLKQINKKETILPSSALCSLWALSGFGFAHPHWGRKCTSLTQMLISSKKTLTDTSRNNVQSGHPVAQSD